MEKRKNDQQNVWEGITGAVILIGIGLIFLLEIDIWPWIMVVIGLAILPGSISREGLWAGVQGSLWLFGIAILAITDAWWPGILILIGISTLVGALCKPPMFDKPKRGLPPENEYEYDYEDHQ